MRLIGYARVSTHDQDTDAQLHELRAAGCDEVYEEYVSGAARARPALAEAVAALQPGDTLVVVRLDRLARSLRHLLDVVERISAKGAHFRSLHDPIDTSSPQGTFTLQILGAVAELERALIRERTRAGLERARRQGRRGGNPALMRGDGQARARLAAQRRRAHLDGLIAEADAWLPVVRRLRPHRPWPEVVRAVNARLPREEHFTVDRLRRAVRTLVGEGLAERELLGRAPRRPADDRLVTVVAGIAGADPGLSLRQIAERLASLRETPPRGGERWSPSSVRHLLQRARRLGLLPSARA